MNYELKYDRSFRTERELKKAIIDNGYLYENIFRAPSYQEEDGEIKKVPKSSQEVIARVFDPITKQSEFWNVTNMSIPNIWARHQNGTYVSHLDHNIKLSPKTFHTMQDHDKYVKDIKIKTGVMIPWIDEDTGEETEFEETQFEDNVYGYVHSPHIFIHRYFTDSLKSEHLHRTWFLDIETRAFSDFKYKDIQVKVRKKDRSS